MTKVLSIDPGETTGIAVYDGDTLRFTMTVSQDQCWTGDFMRGLILMTKPDVVLIEGVPTRTPSVRQADLARSFFNYFKIVGQPAIEIQPSQWKNFVERAKIDGSHATDAATMGKWWIKNHV